MNKKDILDQISRKLSQLNEREYFEVSMINGEIEITGRKDLRNRGQTVTGGIQPVKANWFALSPGKGIRRYAGFGKPISTKRTKVEKSKDIIKGGITLNLMFSSPEEGTPVSTGHDHYLKYQIGDYEVYTRLDMSPVWYQSVNGEKVYV